MRDRLLGWLANVRTPLAHKALRGDRLWPWERLALVTLNRVIYAMLPKPQPPPRDVVKSVHDFEEWRKNKP